jgi:hypothetical protein
MRLSLFSFLDDVHSDGSALINGHDDRRVLQLTNGQYATLLDCVDAGSGDSGDSRTNFIVFQQHVIPNTVLLGTRAWGPSELVRSIQFKFVGANSALHYSEHSAGHFEASSERTGQALDTHVVEYSKLDILTAKGGPISVKHWMSVVMRLGIDRDARSTPVVIAGLDEGVEIKSSLSIVYEILAFFEMSLGVRSRAYEIYVSPLTETERIASMEVDGNDQQFLVRLFYGDWQPSKRRTHPGDVVFPVYSSSQRGATSTTLSSWLERRQGWRTAYALASAYLREPDLYDRDRLLRLFAWFEAIPVYQEQSGMSPHQNRKLSRAVSQKAQELGIQVDKGRIREVLNELKRRPLKARMTGAVDLARARFGETFIPPETLQDCLEAVRFRNLAAHGDLTAGHYEFSLFERAIDAVQMICFLSMLPDLDSTDPPVQLRPSSQHPLMSYRLLRRRT